MNSCTSRIFVSLLALALLGPAFGACVQSVPLSITGNSGGSPGTGATGSGTGGQGGSCVNSTGGTGAVGAGAGGAPQNATFATVGQIVMYKCGGSSCHNSGQNPSLANDSTLYPTLTTARAPDCMNYLIVNPGSPDQSALYLVLAGACGCVPQMPNGCTGGDPTSPNYSCLPPDYIEGVREWIANGAPQQ